MYFVNRSFINWIHLVSSIDRYLAIKFPHRFSFRNNYQFIVKILILVFIILCAVYIPVLYFIEKTNDSKCSTKPETLIWLNICDMIISVLFPSFVMIVSSCLIGFSLIQNKRKLELDIKKEKKLFKILLSIDLFFFLCFFSYSLQIVFDNFQPHFYKKFLFVFIFFHFIYFLMFLHTSCSFFVHFLSNRKFRRYFLTMIKNTLSKKGKENSKRSAFLDHITRKGDVEETENMITAQA